MLGKRALPAHVSVLLLALTLGCDSPPIEPSDTSAAPQTQTAESSDPLTMEPPDDRTTLDGSRFRSVEFHDVGAGVHGIPTLGRWQITFDGGEFVWAGGQSEESGPYTCAGLDLTGLTTGGRELSGNHDPSTGLLTWDGIVYLNESEAANADACAAIDGNAFSGLEASEAGLGPDGVTYGRAGISFEGGDFHWSYSDVTETGAYTCAEGRVIATRLDGSEITGRYDPVMGTLTWAGAGYGDPREFPDADP